MKFHNAVFGLCNIYYGYRVSHVVDFTRSF